MPRIREDIWIDAPIEEVFDYLTTPENHMEIIPSLIDITNVEQLPDEGHEGDFAYKVAGITLDAHFRDVDLDPPTRRVYEVTGDLEGTTTYRLDEEDEGTRFTYEFDYETPGPGILEAVTEPVVHTYLERENETSLENTKMMLEA